MRILERSEERSDAVEALLAHGHWGGMMAGWWWIWVVVAVFSIVMIGALALIVRSVTSASGAPDDGARSARRILAERYARGEISTEEYEERRRTLDEQAR
jgi:putative membrane protein